MTATNRFKILGRFAMLALAAAATGSHAWGAPGGSASSDWRVEVSFPRAVHAAPITGRLFLMISHTNEPEVRLQSTWFNSPEMIGVDVKQLEPDQAVVVDAKPLGTPLRSLADLTPGDYYVQAVLNIYTQFHRADGHVLWLHNDQGEGQQFTRSPGNLFSRVQKVHVDGSMQLHVSLSEVIPPIPTPADTEWVNYVRIQSKLLTQFWGRPIYLGAVVLLPRGYEAHPKLHYPVIYYQPEHFRSFPPFEFSTENSPESEAGRRHRESAGYETGFEFAQSWRSDHFPRMIAVSIQTPTPWSDWSGGVDSANNGPYGQAILTELIPQIEERFRIIRAPYARVLTGKHSGGRAALALQLLHSDFFGGVWAFHPWSFNFERWSTLDIYDRDNAYAVGPRDLPDWAGSVAEWLPLERYIARSTSGVPYVTFRQLSEHDLVMAGMAGGDPLGADDAILGPVGTDGYPQRLWNRTTGQIDREVANYWRAHGDIVDFTKRNWSTIGPNLVGKLHLYIGDMDEFYRNYGVHLFQDFLKGTTNPHYEGSFDYAPLRSGWQPMNNAELVRIMADHIARNAPAGTQGAWMGD